MRSLSSPATAACLVTAILALAPGQAAALVGVNLGAGAGVVSDGLVGPEVEIFPYMTLAMFDLELGYRQALRGGGGGSVVPGARVGVQRDLASFAVVSLYWEVDVQTTFKGGGPSAMARLGGSFGL